MSAEGALTRALADRLTGRHYDAIPDDAMEVARQCFLDFIGVALAGCSEPVTRILYEDQQSAGGNEQATLIGFGSRGTTEQAAMINGSGGHAHDYDDVNVAMFGHPTVAVAPAVLAIGEHLGVSGAELIKAFAKGVDAECIVGQYIGPSHYAAGWHATSTLGAIGAAVACGSLYQLDSVGMTRAIGIAATRAAGLKAQFGTMCKPLHAGHAAATGIVSARLASRGFTSREDILEVAQGFGATQSRSTDAAAFDVALSERSFLPFTCFKYHAACYLTHSSIEATHALIDRFGIVPDDIEAIEITVPSGHFGVCTIENPATGLESKFSLRFTTAMAIAGIDTSSIDTFTDELTARRELTALRDKVRVIAWKSPRPESRVLIRTCNGTFDAEANIGVPAQDLDLQRTKLEGKFMALVKPRIGSQTASELIEIFRKLDRQTNLDALVQRIGQRMGETLYGR
jgi:2-methylcitrate dehydratase PrpD